MQRSGEYISNLSGETMDKSFRPALLPPVIDMDNEIARRILQIKNFFDKKQRILTYT